MSGSDQDVSGLAHRLLKTMSAGRPRNAARRAVTWAVTCGVAVTIAALPAGAATAGVPTDARGATPTGLARPELAALSDDHLGAIDTVPAAPADPTLFGLSAVDLLGSSDMAPPVAEVERPDDAEPFDPPTVPAAVRRPATIPVPGAVYLFPTGAALALYASRRMRARCRRRG